MARVVSVDAALLARVRCALSGIQRLREIAVSGTTATAQLRVSEHTVPELCGHFPDRPAVPAVVLLEAMMQTAAALVPAELQVSRMQSATFRRTISPPQEVTLCVEYDAQNKCFDSVARLPCGAEVATASFNSSSSENTTWKEHLPTISAKEQGSS